MTPTRQCSSCSLVLTLDPRHFRPHDSGFRHKCRRCEAAYQRPRDAQRASRRRARAEADFEIVYEELTSFEDKTDPYLGDRVDDLRPAPQGLSPSFTKRVVQTGTNSTVVCIPDLHCPWWDRPALDKALQIIAHLQPTDVVQMGDAYDYFSFSRFPRSPNVIKPQEEVDQARQCLEFMWSEIRRLAPNASCWQLEGNHDARIMRQGVTRFPEVLGFLVKAHTDLITFEGVTTVPARDDLEIDGVLYTHGDDLATATPGRRLRQAGKSVVFGHIHRGFSFFENMRQGLLFELACGHLANPEAEPLAYNPKRFVNWTRGIGIVERGVPRFVPL